MKQLTTCQCRLIKLFVSAILSICLLANQANAQEHKPESSWWNLFANEQLVSIVVEVPYIELRSGPGIGYPVLNIVEKGETLNIILKRTTWLKVEDKRGNQGWLYQGDLNGVTQEGSRVRLSTEYQFEDYLLRDWEGGFMYGDLEGANYFNVYLGYAFSPVFSSEISYGRAIGDVSDSTIIEANLVASPYPEWFITPYVLVGGGTIETTPHSVLAKAEDRNHTLLSAALGLKYHLARNVLIRSEIKQSIVLTDRDENEEIQTWKIGFSVFF
ncbi:hypothetical protein C2869_13300 [Saccharobesus litoralis]|uniref:SH3b domain-containing protein n=1 Tax=Saccharobesus litoralis TaxID=2172099 RepID=A0A2S0VT16_9ALTE|nr:SH3 domain-containing protein [Saccharobesus litoralis]AWB67355.1 hypothetical protein C2869_13300 [Saccharobesus litoralis]